MMSSCHSLPFLGQWFPTYSRTTEGGCFKVQNAALQVKTPAAAQTSKQRTAQGNTTECYGEERDFGNHCGGNLGGRKGRVGGTVGNTG